MKIYLKYLIVFIGFICAVCSLQVDKIGAGITAAGAFIAFALIEIQDLKTLNQEQEEKKD